MLALPEDELRHGVHSSKEQAHRLDVLGGQAHEAGRIPALVAYLQAEQLPPVASLLQRLPGARPGQAEGHAADKQAVLNPASLDAFGALFQLGDLLSAGAGSHAKSHLQVSEGLRRAPVACLIRCFLEQ